MLSVLLSWLYIFLLCLLVGAGGRALLERLLPVPVRTLSGHTVLGVVLITVYAQYFSIFHRIALAAQLILLLCALLSAFFCKARLLALWREYRPVLFSWEGFFYLLLIFFLSFFTSRGQFHFDTNLYHAAAIRVYEEAGVIRGLANLQLHYGYNSAYLVFASVFSFGWLFPQPLHTTTGFLEALFALYACRGLCGFRRRVSHFSDAGYLAILIYILVIVAYSMSPATDYGAMLFSLYTISAWLTASERREDVYAYAWFSVLCVFVLTLKLSAGLIVLCALYPALCLLRRKRWTHICLLLASGLLVLLPWLIRNVLLSGWLIYPFGRLDLFSFVWKVPVAALTNDAAQIKVWGRCLYDVSLLNLPLRAWLPVWWNGQQYYEKMLIYSNLLAVFFLFLQVFRKMLRGRKPHMARLSLYLSIFASAVFWFLEAPFIRYGLAFLLILPLSALAVWFDGWSAPAEQPDRWRGLYRILAGLCMLLTIFTFTPFVDNYFADLYRFVRKYGAENAVLLQQAYDIIPMQERFDYGYPVYLPDGVEACSYYDYPCTAYPDMYKDSLPMGRTPEAGFMPKPSD